VIYFGWRPCELHLDFDERIRNLHSDIFSVVQFLIATSTDAEIKNHLKAWARDALHGKRYGSAIKVIVTVGTPELPGIFQINFTSPYGSFPNCEAIICGNIWRGGDGRVYMKGRDLDSKAWARIPNPFPDSEKLEVNPNDYVTEVREYVLAEEERYDIF